MLALPHCPFWDINLIQLTPEIQVSFLRGLFCVEWISERPQCGEKNTTRETDKQGWGILLSLIMNDSIPQVLFMTHLFSAVRNLFKSFIFDVYSTFQHKNNMSVCRAMAIKCLLLLWWQLIGGIFSFLFNVVFHIWRPIREEYHLFLQGKQPVKCTRI